MGSLSLVKCERYIRKPYGCVLRWLGKGSGCASWWASDHPSALKEVLSESLSNVKILAKLRFSMYAPIGNALDGVIGKLSCRWGVSCHSAWLWEHICNGCQHLVIVAIGDLGQDMTCYLSLYDYNQGRILEVSVNSFRPKLTTVTRALLHLIWLSST